MASTAHRKHLRYALPAMTHRGLRSVGLANVVVFVALACGSSHGGEPPDGGSAGAGSGTGTAGTGIDPVPGTGGGVIDPGPIGGVGNAPTTGGVGTGGSVIIGGSGGFGGASGSSTGGVATAGTGGVQYPPGSCPALPPPNGSSCASYVVDPDFRCFYDAPACRVESTCTAGAKWRSGCEAPGGEAGSPSGEAGAAGAAGAAN